MLNPSALKLLEALRSDIADFDMIHPENQEAIALWILEDRGVKKEKDYAENKKVG